MGLELLVAGNLGLCGGRFRRAGWDGERKRGAAVGIVLGPDPAAVRFHDGAADRQAHPHPAGFGGVERVENTRELVGRDTRALIPHGNVHSGIGVQRPDHDPPRLARGAHRFHAVEHEVEQHLLDLDPVAADQGKIGREVQDEIIAREVGRV